MESYIWYLKKDPPQWFFKTSLTAKKHANIKYIPKYVLNYNYHFHLIYPCMHLQRIKPGTFHVLQRQLKKILKMITWHDCHVVQIRPYKLNEYQRHPVSVLQRHICSCTVNCLKIFILFHCIMSVKRDISQIYSALNIKRLYKWTNKKKSQYWFSAFIFTSDASQSFICKCLSCRYQWLFIPICSFFKRRQNTNHS